MTRVVVLMASYNRREKTLTSLRALRSALTLVPYVVYLVDDGSTDGTSETVAEQFTEVSVIHGDGNLYWAASMCLAERLAFEHQFDYLLWLNDDTELLPGAIDRMIELAKGNPKSIIVGATVDPDTGELTYGGRRRRDAHPLRFSIVEIWDTVQDVQNFNGNCVLVPVDVRLALGPIDGSFPHAYADHDYGQRAMNRSIRMLQVPSFVGYCAKNPPVAVPSNIIERWRHYESPKALPWRAQFRYLKRHGSATWGIYFIAGTAKRLVGVGDQ